GRLGVPRAALLQVTHSGHAEPCSLGQLPLTEPNPPPVTPQQRTERPPSIDLHRLPGPPHRRRSILIRPDYGKWAVSSRTAVRLMLTVPANAIALGGQLMRTSTSATPARQMLGRIAVAGVLSLAISGTAAVIDASPAAATPGPCYPGGDGFGGIH